MTDQMWDLYEFHFDRTKGEKGLFVKYQAHVLNQPKAICYGQKKKIEFLTPRSRLTRFRVVKNGTLQYTNSFKPNQNPR